MRGAKYIVLLLGICMILVFCGEENQELVYGFLEDNPFFFVDSQNKEMYAESFGKTITELAAEHHVGLFAKDAVVGKDGLEEFFVYLNDIQEEWLRKNNLYIEGECKSLFSDSVRVSVRDFSKFAAEQTMPDQIYVIGPTEIAKKIRKTLVDEYNVSEVKMGVSPEETDVIIYLWIIIGVTFWFLTAVDSIITRKRGLIRAVIGVGRRRQVIEGVICDTLGLTATFLIAYLILGQWYVFYNTSIHLICLGIVLAGSIAIQTVLSKTNVRKALRQVQIDRDVLGVLCVVKIVITVLSLLIIAGLINEIHKTRDIRKTLDQLRELQDYYFVSVFCPDESLEEEQSYQEWLSKLISEKQADYKPLYFSERGYGTFEDDAIKMVEVSYYARDMIEITAKYRESEHDSDYIVLIPQKELNESHSHDEEDGSSDLDEMLRDACGGESFEKILYEETAEMVCTTAGEGRLALTTCKNPVVLLRNHPDTGESIARVMQDLNEGAMKVMFCLPEGADVEEIQLFSGGRYQVAAGEVRALVEEQVHRQEMFVFSESILCALVLLYNLLLSLRLTQIDYLVNRRKNTIGVILGRTLIERYRGTVVRYAVTTAVSLVVIVVLCMQIRFSGIGAVLACGGFLCCIDILLYLFRMRRMEKKNIKSVITGGIYA